MSLATAPVRADGATVFHCNIVDVRNNYQHIPRLVVKTGYFG